MAIVDQQCQYTNISSAKFNWDTAAGRGHARHPVEYLGVIYRSKKQLCEELKISYSIFCKKILDGENIEDAVQACQNETGK